MIFYDSPFFYYLGCPMFHDCIPVRIRYEVKIKKKKKNCEVNITFGKCRINNIVCGLIKTM